MLSSNSRAYEPDFIDTSNNQYQAERVNFSLPQGWTIGEVAAIIKRENGNFIVFNRGQHQLIEFDHKRNFVREIGQGLFETPHGLRLDAHGNIWTADSGTHLVLRFSPSGEVTMVLGKNKKAGKGWFHKDYNVVFFDQPLDVAQDRFNNIYVVDKGNSRIVKLDSNGMLIKTWGQAGTKPGQFNFPHSIVIDKYDRIYVADRENKRIQRFDLDGSPLDQWNSVGYPYVLTLESNSLWMTDARAEKVLQLDLDGNQKAMYQGTPGRNPGQFSSVHGIYASENGNVWVTQIFNWGGINKLTPTR
jgi:streptogramin lyase